MVAEHLMTGREHAVKAEHLSKVLSMDVRDVMRCIEQERRNGKQICADSTGLWLAANDDELQAFIRRFRHHAHEINKTADAMNGVYWDKLPSI